MKTENFNIPAHKPKVLIAPLDWGLGHATRCIPIISTLIKQHCTVIVAAEGQIKRLLKEEFPDLQFIELRGYRVKYSRNALWMPVKLLVQLPKILYRIYAENRWLAKTIKENNINAVISDNRMGLYSKKIPCVYITHQLLIKTGQRFTESFAQKIHYHYINKFDYCWVPDTKAALNLGGELSHPRVLPKIPVTYIGFLSRFEKTTLQYKYDLCIILSGPEPQRTIFETMILADIEKMSQQIYLARGLPLQGQILQLSSPSIKIKNHLPADELSTIIQQSKIIISRCGYSTVMDLVKLQKKAILVATPGQTEQEYLSGYLHAKKMFWCVDQKKFSLSEVLKTVVDFKCNNWPVNTDDYTAVIKNFIAALKL